MTLVIYSIFIVKTVIMINKKSDEININDYVFVPKNERENLKRKLESSNRRWVDIVDTIKKHRKRHNSE